MNPTMSETKRIIRTIRENKSIKEQQDSGIILSMAILIGCLIITLAVLIQGV